jgi:DNA-binding GntR family transcriptional regulator
MADDALVRITLPEQIYRILREEILTQTIPCGAKLTLQALKTRFGVSHTPIREALTRLVEDDLVTYHSNVGVTVVSLSPTDIREVFQLICDLDRLAITYARRTHSWQALLDALDANVAQCHALLDAGDFAGWSVASDGFHLAFHAHSGNGRLTQAAHKLWAQVTLIYNLYHLEELRCTEIQQRHDAIAQRLRLDDLPAAFDALAQHLD